MVRIYLLSDIHINHPANWKWITELPKHPQDILIIAGDVSHDITEFTKCFNVLLSKFKHVFFTPGNHDLWVLDQDSGADSVSKLDDLLQTCEHLGVKTKPEYIDGLWIVPMFSWYDSTLATTDPLTRKDIEELKKWSDLYFCKWPKEYKPLDLYERNEDFIQNFDLMDCSPIISFSHMLPRRELLPPRDELTHKFLPHVVGSTRLEKQIRALGSHTHLFGHSHVNKDVTIDGVRYIQNALGYPKEREQYNYTPILKQVWPPLPASPPTVAPAAALRSVHSLTSSASSSIPRHTIRVAYDASAS